MAKNALTGYDAEMQAIQKNGLKFVYKVQEGTSVEIIEHHMTFVRCNYDNTNYISMLLQILKDTNGITNKYRTDPSIKNIATLK